MKPPIWIVGAVAMLLGVSQTAWSATPRKTEVPKAIRPVLHNDGRAEARLVEVYRRIGASDSQGALRAAETLVRDHPNFQLAQLTYGDLLTAHNRPVRALGDMAGDLPPGAMARLQELREESRLRLLALRERPPAQSIPRQLLSLSPRNKHAIVVDVSKSRLYLFANAASGPQLLADYYISVGKAGVDKRVEGDQRTPLGIYFVTSSLDPKSLKDLYGAGALPINYPNALDVRNGRGGSGIWLHGTPSAQFSRAPLATDGCVAVANPDLERILRTVEIRSTPVVIARSLRWVTPGSLFARRQAFDALLQSWAQAKSAGNFAGLGAFYASDFTADDKTLAAHAAIKAGRQRHGNVALRDVSLLQTDGDSEVVVATFGEVAMGEKSGRTIRQYWERRGTQWKIVFEGVVG